MKRLCASAAQMPHRARAVTTKLATAARPPRSSARHLAVVSPSGERHVPAAEPNRVSHAIRICCANRRSGTLPAIPRSAATTSGRYLSTRARELGPARKDSQLAVGAEAYLAGRSSPRPDLLRRASRGAPSAARWGAVSHEFPSTGYEITIASRMQRNVEGLLE